MIETIQNVIHQSATDGTFVAIFALGIVIAAFRTIAKNF
jgi:hypothetical protein